MKQLLELTKYLVCPSLTAAGGRLGTVVLSSLSPPCQRQTVECYSSLWSNSFASSWVLILFRRNSWQISDLHVGGAAAHELAESQSRCSLSSSLSGSTWQHSCKNDWPGLWGKPRVSQGWDRLSQSSQHCIFWERYLIKWRWKKYKKYRMQPPDFSIFLLARSSLKFESNAAASWSSLLLIKLNKSKY